MCVRLTNPALLIYFILIIIFESNYLLYNLFTKIISVECDFNNIQTDLYNIRNWGQFACY